MAPRNNLMPPTTAGTPTTAGRYVSKTEMTAVATAKAMIATENTTKANSKDDDSNSDNASIKKGRTEKE